MMKSRRLIGTVVSFDEAVGLGGIEADGAAGSEGGTPHFPFHCTQIADGTRAVAVGTRVSFGLLAGRAGRWEAADIRTAAG